MYILGDVGNTGQDLGQTGGQTAGDDGQGDVVMEQDNIAAAFGM